MFDCSQMVTILFNLLASHVLLFITICTQSTLVNTQNVSVTKRVDSYSVECAESKYGLRIQLLSLGLMIYKVGFNA